MRENTAYVNLFLGMYVFDWADGSKLVFLENPKGTVHSLETWKRAHFLKDNWRKQRKASPGAAVIVLPYKVWIALDWNQ